MSGIEETSDQSERAPIMDTVYLEATNPRSVLRHRPIHPTSATTENTPLVARASRRTRKINIEEPETEPGKVGASESAGGNELRPIGTATKAIAPPSPAKGINAQNLRTRPHWLIWLGLGMGVTLLGVMLVQLATGWITTLSDDLHYGRPRTFQTDAFVGHETGKVASHFIVVNLQGQIHIIEMAGGDPQQVRVFVGPHLVGNDAELVPATISFVDSRHDRHPDMYLQAGNIQVVFHNVDGTFKVTQ